MGISLIFFLTSYLYIFPIISTFNSPQEFFAQEYAFFNKYFYKIDPSYYESHLENPLNLSTCFMLECLLCLYAKRTDIVCDSMHKDEEVDAIIIAPHRTQDGISTRFISLKRSLEEHNWRFRRIYIFVINAEHEQKCEKELIRIFPENHDRLAIEWVHVHHQNELYRHGLKSLKYSDCLAGYHIFIEESEQLAEKYMMESCKSLAGTSICLGANIFSVKNFLEHAIIHKYHIFYPHYDDMICAWFHTEMNLYARALHYKFLYSKNIDAKEQFICKRIRQKESHHDLEESYYFKKLAILHLQKSLIAENQVSQFIELLCSLGILLYAQEIYASEDKIYHIDKHIQILKESLFINFSKKGLILLQKQDFSRKCYKEAVNNICLQTVERWANVNSENVYCAYQEIAQLQELLFKKIIEDSLTIVGKPPCLFAVILYGSIARKETTPYSDVEFGFLTEKYSTTEKDYFEKLAAVIIYKLINIEKTPVSYLNIPNLNMDFLTGNYSKFIDYIMPAGFSPDMFNSGRLPIAEEREKSYCGTVNDMAELYIHDANERGFFVTEKFLYGERSLFSQYKIQKFRNFSLNEKCYNILRTDILSFPRTLRQNNGQIDIKTTFYRPFTVILEKLTACLNVQGLSSYERIMALHLNKYITKNEVILLEEFLKKIMIMRLIIHMHNKQRYGNYPPEQQPYVDELLTLKNKVYPIFNKIFESIKIPSSS